MNKTDKIILEDLDELYNYLYLEYQMASIKMIKNKKDLKVEQEALKDAVTIIEEIINVFRGNRVRHFVSQLNGFSVAITNLDFSKEHKNYITWKVLEKDLESMQLLLENKGLLLSKKQQEALLKYDLSNRQFSDLLTLEEEKGKELPFELQEAIQNAKAAEKEKMHIMKNLFAIRDHYFTKKKNFFLTDYQIVLQALRELRLSEKLIDELSRQLKEEIIIPTKDLKPTETLKNRSTHVTSAISSVKRENGEYTNSEKERREILQKIKNFYNLAKDKPVRNLSLLEKAELIDLLESVGYSELECRKIIQKINKTFNKTEFFDPSDYFEKIELIMLLKQCFYSDEKVRQILQGMKCGLTRKNKSLTKEQQIMRNAMIYNNYFKSIKDTEAYNEILEALKQYRKEKKLTQEDAEIWKEFALEMINDNYQQSNYNSEMSEAQRQIKLRSKKND